MPFLTSYLLSKVQPDHANTYDPFAELLTVKRVAWKPAQAALLDFLGKCSSSFQNQQELADLRAWLKHEKKNKTRDILLALNHLFVTGDWCAQLITPPECSLRHQIRRRVIPCK